MKKLLIAACLAAFPALAFAQAPAAVSVTQLDSPTADMVPLIPNGVPNAQTQYASPSLLSGSQGYVRAVPLTAFTLSFANGQVWYLIVPAGTLATGTFNRSPNPVQGTRNCIRSTQTQSGVTLTPPTGTTITSAITSMTANTTYCYIFDAVTSKWDAF